VNRKRIPTIAAMLAILAACADREPTHSGFRAHIMAVRENGSPVPGAVVEMRLDGRPRILRTDAAGQASLELAESPWTWSAESIDGCPVRTRGASGTDGDAVWKLMVTDSTWIPCHRTWIAHVQGPKDTLFTWRAKYDVHGIDSFGSSWKGSRTESVVLDGAGKADLKFDGWLNPFRELVELSFEVDGFRMGNSSVRLRPSDTTFVVDWKPVAGPGIWWWRFPWTCGSTTISIESDSLLRRRSASESSSQLLATIARVQDSIVRGRRPGASGDSIRWVVHLLSGTIDGISVDTGSGAHLVCRATSP